jgi:basic amino acid/polyamine antiporter, APA family
VAKRKHREGQSLHKVLGVPALFSTAYGNVGSSIYYALGVTALYAMGLTPAVLILTGLLFMTTAWTYSEATAMLPEAGGSSSFARRAFNEFVSFGAGWGLMLDYIITMAISAFFVPNYLAAFWPILKVWPYNSIGGILVIVFLVAINVIGIKEAARLNIILAILDLATQTLLMVVGLALLFRPAILIHSIHLGVAPTWTQFIYGISIGTIAYTGIETVSNMAEEAANPGKDVPRAVNFVLIAVLAVYTGMSLVGLTAMPVKGDVVPYDPATHMTVPVKAILPDPTNKPNGPWVYADNRANQIHVAVKRTSSGASTGTIEAQKPTAKPYMVNGQWRVRLYGSQISNVYLDDPLQGIVQNIPNELSWLRAILKPWIGILAATILIIGTNAGIIGVSRLAYSMGQHRQIPPVLGRVHPKRLTPYVSIILFGTVAALLILPGKTTLLAELYAFGAMISFTTAHVSVVALRFKEPNLARPFHTPFSVPFRGKSLPLTAVVGGIGTFTVWCIVVATHPTGRLIGFSWMGIGLVTYVVYRRVKGYSLTKTVERVVLPEAVASDIDYDQILVPIVGSRITDEMMVLACQLATEKESSIDALYVIEVPMNLPLDARLVKERARAQGVLNAAKAIADQFGIQMRPHVITARGPGRAIVDIAEERKSEVIIIGSVRKRRMGEFVFGNTVNYVLQHSPCEVIVNLVPTGYPTAGSAEIGMGAVHDADLPEQSADPGAGGEGGSFDGRS